MRKLLTSGNLVIIASLEVCLDNRARMILEVAFDEVICLYENNLTQLLNKGLHLEHMALLKTFALHNYNVCVWLSPNIFAVKNSDQIFDFTEENNFVLSCLPNNDTSLCKIKPSRAVYDYLLKSLQQEENISKFPDTLLNLLSFRERVGVLEDKWKLCMNSMKLKCSIPQKLYLVEADDEGKQRAEYNIVENIIWNWKKNLVAETMHLLQRTEETSDSYRMDASPSEEFYHNQNLEPIAIIGMSCRYPKCNNLNEFWELLVNAEDGVGAVPPNRWRPEHTIKPVQNPSMKAGFLDFPIDEFDTKFFGVNNAEAVYIDPQHRLLLQVAWEAFEDAGIDPEKMRGTNAGVFVASWMNEYKDIINNSTTDDFFRCCIGNCNSAGSARISHLLGTTGPSLTFESGCASSLVAVHHALQSLRKKETNLAVVGGVNLLLHPFSYEDVPSVLTSDGKCKTFDAKADGYVRSEGCGVLILKRLSDAWRDDDMIWALIRGSGVTHEGLSKAIGTPTVTSESLATQLALQNANVEPQHVQYVEAHGTGTPIGDPLEMSSIALAYHSKLRKQRLLVGSVKTNIGHTESCSGIAGVMKVVLAMHKGMIPRHRNFDTLSPGIDLDAIPATIPTEAVEWPRPGPFARRFAGVSSYGMTGTDAHAILEEPPVSPMPNNESNFQRPFHVLKITAKTENSLLTLSKKYEEMFMQNDDDEQDHLEDICFTLNTGRSNFAHRAMVVGRSKEEIGSKLQRGDFFRGVASTSTSTSTTRGKICFLFTGQGSQYTNMAANLYKTCPVFKIHFDVCSNFLQKYYQLNINTILWDPHSKQAENKKTVCSQTGIFCVEYPLMMLWKSWGICPDFVLGHSLGEFCAAVCAGILTVEDALRLVVERSILIDQLPGGKMLAVKAGIEMVKSKLLEFSRGNADQMLDIAAINSDDQTVVSGDTEIVLDFAAFLKQTGNIKSTILDASHAFHSKHMDPILTTYGKLAFEIMKKNVDNRITMTCGYISGVHGDQLREQTSIDSQYWIDHCRNPVLFKDACRKAMDLECTNFIEIGPHPVLSILTLENSYQNLSIECVPSLRKTEPEWKTLLDSLSRLYIIGHNIDWKGFDAFSTAKRLRGLPHYQFTGKSFWPEIISVKRRVLHPLLGSPIPTASSTKLFQCDLNLTSEPYLKEHMIGKTIVFPAAAFLEMCLAVVYATNYKSEAIATWTTRAVSKPLQIKNLSISAPLGLVDSSSTCLQTIVKTDFNQFKIQIFHLQQADNDEVSNKWISHASAVFDPVSDTTSLKDDFPSFESVKAHLSDDVGEPISDVYESVGSFGVNYGSTFRVLEKMWKLENGRGIIVEGNISTVLERSSDYLMHPVLLDSMLQALYVYARKSNEMLTRKLLVPVKIGCFQLYSSIKLPNNNNNSTIYYIFADETTVVLIDSEGQKIAAMNGVEFAETSVIVVEALIHQQSFKLPDFWEETWKPKFGANNLRFQLDATATVTIPQIAKEVGISSQLSAQHLNLYQLLNEYLSAKLIASAYDSGFPAFQEGDLFTLERLMEWMQVGVEHQSYLRFLMGVMESKDLISRNTEVGQDEITWMVRRPNKKDLSSTPTTSTDLRGKQCDYARVVDRLTKQIPQLLRGKISGVDILFDSQLLDSDPTSLKNFYESYQNDFEIGSSTTIVGHNGTDSSVYDKKGISSITPSKDYPK